MLILLVWNNTLPLNYGQFVEVAAMCGLRTPPERSNFKFKFNFKLASRSRRNEAFGLYRGKYSALFFRMC